MKQKTSKFLIPLFATVFVDLVGLGIVIPTLAPLFLNAQSGIFNSGVSLQARTVALGLLIASYPLAQFLVPLF